MSLKNTLKIDPFTLPSDSGWKGEQNRLWQKIRDIISQAWWNDEKSIMHFGVMQIGGRQYDVEFLIQELAKIGVTKENNGAFAEYCYFLTSSPEIILSQFLVHHTSGRVDEIL